MRRRRDPGRRCSECRMLRALCICDQVPRLQTRTHLVLILHQTEAGKTTNTGRLAARCLIGSRIVIRGAGNPTDDGPLWPPDHDPVLLFPAPDARPISHYAQRARPVALVVPDGTWGQASRTRNRIAALAGIPAAVIPTTPAVSGAADPEQALPPLRRPHLPGQRPTIDAIARALEVLEGENGPHVRAELECIHRIMVVRTLRSRGQLSGLSRAGVNRPHPE